MNKATDKKQSGSHIIGFAIILPILILIGLVVADQLIATHRYNLVHHALSELANDAREMEELRGDFWYSSDIAARQEAHDRFVKARNLLATKFSNEIRKVGAIAVKEVTHLDRMGDTATFVNEPLAVLPPGTSAYVSDWDSASINNSHVCGMGVAGTINAESLKEKFDAAVRNGIRKPTDTSPRRDILGERSECKVAWIKSEEQNSLGRLPGLTSHFPTELTAVLEVKSLYGQTYPVIVTVPFYHKSAMPQGAAVQSCAPKWQRTLSAWSTACGPGTRTRTDSDLSCGNQSVFTEQRCVGGCGWSRIWTGACSASCGGGIASFTNQDLCGGYYSGQEQCNTQLCPCFWTISYTAEVNNQYGYSSNHKHNIVNRATINVCGKTVTTKTNFVGKNTGQIGYQVTRDRVTGVFDPLGSALQQIVAEGVPNSEVQTSPGQCNSVRQDRGGMNYVCSWPVTYTKYSSSTKTYYLDENCNSIIKSTAGRRHCGHADLTERFFTPISLVLSEGATISPIRATFRLDPNGKPDQVVNWYASSDAPLLVWDPQHTGAITSGEQLFGSFSFGKRWPTGYEALATLDKDRDGKVAGSELQPIGVWLDKNRDAVSQKGEVVQPNELGIVEIFVTPDSQQKDKDLGFVWATKGYTRTVDGELKTLPSVDWFTPITEGAISVGQGANNRIPIDKAAAAIPGNTPFDAWKWSVNGDGKDATANKDGFLTVQRGEEGSVRLVSVVVGEITGAKGPESKEELDKALGSHVATATSLHGKESRNKDGTISLIFEGVVVDNGRNDSGVEIHSSATIGSDGKTMKGITRQEPFGGSKARPVSYKWSAVKVLDNWSAKNGEVN